VKRLAAAVLLALTTAACGGGSKAGPTPSATPTVPAGPVVLVGFDATFPAKPLKTVDPLPGGGAGATVTSYRVDAHGLRFVVQDATPANVVKGKERASLSEFLPVYFANYKYNLRIDPAATTISGRVAVSYIGATADGSDLVGKAVVRDQHLFVVFVTGSDPRETTLGGTSFVDSFTLV
jgi:hypothetical protein